MAEAKRRSLDPKEESREQRGRDRHASVSAKDKRPSVWQIVERRLLSFEYIKSVCSGDCHWLSLVQLDLSDDGKQDETPQALRWYHLGVSIAPLLQLPSGPSFVRAVLQLFEELTYHFSSTARQNIRKISRFARPANRATGSSTGSEDDFNAGLSRVNGEVVYEFLFTPFIAHAISATHVLQAFCDQMLKLYRKLAEAAQQPSSALTDAIVKVDGLVEEHFLTSVAKHVNVAADAALRKSLSGADPLFRKLLGGGSRNSEDLGEGSRSENLVMSRNL
uniref:Uncharacterized protein n=1 Tax=Haptolina ericina TaxID=156174 RepID=A0A7S3F7T6_9EUKA|mmetsp:Transcript_57393/g.128130  ORF Transcript_57393/g.128130 Transcript_57393/m.128130 type:complete len:277 (+) Transcript_57393:39-869(+)